MLYTNVSIVGDWVQYRGIEGNKRITERRKMIPSLFLPSSSPTKFKTIDGNYLTERKFPSIKEAKDFVSQYKNTNFPIFGNQQYEYVYIAQNFPNDIAWKFSDIRIATIDLEWGSENGFADPKTVEEPITAITLQLNNKIYAFGCGEYQPASDVTYIHCQNERDLLDRFIQIWSADYPDVITGWYSRFADTPYLVNRIIKLFGEDKAKKLSPWNYIYQKNIVLMGKEQQTYLIAGIANLDYLELYRKFDPHGNSQENYKLDNICNVELGEKKLSYAEYGSLHNLYKENFQKFMDYNVRDVKLIGLLEKRKKLLELAFTLAYKSKTNYDDVFTQTRMWDAIIYNFLLKDNVIIPERKSTPKKEYVGAYVKEPQPGLHRWVISEDFTSLYPKLTMMYNISPDTIVNDPSMGMQICLAQPINVQTLLKQEIDVSYLLPENVGLTPNQQLFRRDKEGFMPKILKGMFADRIAYKNKMLDAKKELEKTKDPDLIAELTDTISRYDILQKVTKICLNSCYGTVGNEFFRFFDVRQAEAITTAGQLAILWIQKNINEYLNTLLQTKDIDYVIASDTDSVYIVLDRLVDKVYPDEKEYSISTINKIVDFLDKACKAKIQPFIDQCCKDLAIYTNAFAQELEMKREKICDIGLITSAKHYIWNTWDEEGVRYSKPKVSIVGLDMIKSTTPEISRKKLKDTVNYILTNDQKGLHKFIESVHDEFMTLPIEEIASPIGMRGLNEYQNPKTLYRKGTPIHVRGSLLYNHYLKEENLTKDFPLIQDGEKIKYCYLKLPNPIKEDVIAFPMVFPKELGLNDYVDREKQFDKGFISPLKIILDVINWNIEPKNTLEAFFG